MPFGQYIATMHQFPSLEYQSIAHALMQRMHHTIAAPQRERPGRSIIGVERRIVEQQRNRVLAWRPVGVQSELATRNVQRHVGIGRFRSLAHQSRYALVQLIVPKTGDRMIMRNVAIRSTLVITGKESLCRQCLKIPAHSVDMFDRKQIFEDGESLTFEMRAGRFFVQNRVRFQGFLQNGVATAIEFVTGSDQNGCPYAAVVMRFESERTFRPIGWKPQCSVAIDFINGEARHHRDGTRRGARRELMGDR